MERDTYRYRLKLKGKIVHYGVTYDLERREAEHQEEYPDSRIEQVGPATTRDAALKWERKMRRKKIK